MNKIVAIITLVSFSAMVLYAFYNSKNQKEYCVEISRQYCISCHSPLPKNELISLQQIKSLPYPAQKSVLNNAAKSHKNYSMNRHVFDRFLKCKEVFIDKF